MKLIHIFLFVLLPFWIIGQSKISIDGCYSYDRGFRSLSGSNDSTIALKDANEERKTGARYGLNFNFFPNNKIAFKAGIRWVTTGYDSSVGGMNFEYKYLEIPVAIRYYYGENRFRLFSELGIGIHKYRSGNNNSQIIMQKWNYVALVSMGFDFDYSPDLSFFAQPIFRYHLTETYEKNDLPEEHLFNSGIEMGFRVKF